MTLKEVKRGAVGAHALDTVTHPRTQTLEVHQHTLSEYSDILKMCFSAEIYAQNILKMHIFRKNCQIAAASELTTPHCRWPPVSGVSIPRPLRCCSHLSALYWSRFVELHF